MLNDRLLELRKKLKLTQVELSSKLKIARTTYSGYELGTSEPDNDTLERIADFYGVTTDYLLGRDMKEKSTAEKLIGYLEMELTNDEIKERMTFKVDDITLSSEEVDEFVNFVRVQRLMKKQRTPVSSKSEGP